MLPFTTSNCLRTKYRVQLNINTILSSGDYRHINCLLSHNIQKYLPVQFQHLIWIIDPSDWICLKYNNCYIERNKSKYRTHLLLNVPVAAVSAVDWVTIVTEHQITIIQCIQLIKNAWGMVDDCIAREVSCFRKPVICETIKSRHKEHLPDEVHASCHNHT